MMLEELEQVDEDEVPIIDIGGMEPVFAVPEESEDLKLGETEEEAPDVPIDDERPPDLVNLLHDQELYEENPAWKPFQPLSSGQGEPQKPAQPPARPTRSPSPRRRLPGRSSPAASPPPFPQYAAPARPSRQEEAAVPPSLMQALDAQQRMVDRLFDELRDLSRRVDERPRAMPAPTANAGSPPRCPRISRADRSRRSTACRGGLPMPRRKRKPDPRRLPRSSSRRRNPASRNRKLPRNRAAEEPEAPNQMPARNPRTGCPTTCPPASRAWPPPPRPCPTSSCSRSRNPSRHPRSKRRSRGSNPRLRSSPNPSPSPRTWPVLDEVHELSEEEIEPASDIRKELRDYIDGVRRRLEARPVEAAAAGPGMKPENGHKTGALLDYLTKLSEYLPEREKSRFLGSDVRRSMERIRSWLSGGRGPAKTTDGRHHPPAEARPLTRPLLFDAFSYLRGLAGSHPDPAVGAALAKRIEEVIVRIGRAG